jgi:hypothetical protein
MSAPRAPRQSGRHGQTLESETFTLGAKAQQTSLLELVEGALQGGDREAGALAKGGQVGPLADASGAENEQ